MHELWGADNGAAVDLTDALQAKADAEHGDASGEVINHGDRTGGAVGRAGTWADQNAVGVERIGLGQADGITAMHDGVGTQFAEILDEIVDK